MYGDAPSMKTKGPVYATIDHNLFAQKIINPTLKIKCLSDKHKHNTLPFKNIYRSKGLPANIQEIY